MLNFNNFTKPTELSFRLAHSITLLLLVFLTLNSSAWAVSISSSDHPNGGTNLPLQSNLSFQVSTTFELGQGNVILYDLDRNLPEAYFEADDTRISSDGSSFHLYLQDQLRPNTSYSLQISPDFIVPLNEEIFAGIINLNDYNFSTGAFELSFSNSSSNLMLRNWPKDRLHTLDRSNITNHQSVSRFQIAYNGDSSDTLQQIRIYGNQNLDDLFSHVQLWKTGATETLIAEGDVNSGHISGSSFSFQELNLTIHHGPQDFEIRARVQAETTDNILAFWIYNSEFFFSSGQSPDTLGALDTEVIIREGATSAAQLTLLESSITQGSIDVGYDHSLQLQFNCPLALSTTANIQILRQSDNSFFDMYSVQQGNLSIDGGKVTVYTGQSFVPGVGYNINFENFTPYGHQNQFLSQPLPNIAFTASEFSQYTLDLEGDLSVSYDGEQQWPEYIYQGQYTEISSFLLSNKNTNTQHVESFQFVLSEGAPWSLFESIELWNINDPNNPILVSSGNTLDALSLDSTTFTLDGLNEAIPFGIHRYLWKGSLRSSALTGPINVAPPILTSVDQQEVLISNHASTFKHVLEQGHLNNGVLNIAELSPKPLSTLNADNGLSLSITFESGNLSLATGNLQIIDSGNGQLVHLMDQQSGAFNLYNNTLSASLGVILENDKSYDITIEQGLVVDQDNGEASQAVSSNDWSFQTSSQPNHALNMNAQNHSNAVIPTSVPTAKIMHFTLRNHTDEILHLDRLNFRRLLGDWNWIDSVHLTLGQPEGQHRFILASHLKSAPINQGDELPFHFNTFEIYPSQFFNFHLEVQFSESAPAPALFALALREEDQDPSTTSIHMQSLHQYMYRFTGENPLGPITPSVSPEAGTQFGPNNSYVQFYFQESITRGSGNLNIIEASSGNIAQTITANSQQFYVEEQYPYLYLHFYGLEPNQQYWVQVDEGFVKTTSGRPMSAITGQQLWFETLSFDQHILDDPSSVYLQNKSQNLNTIFAPTTETQTVMAFSLAHAGEGATLNELRIRSYDWSTIDRIEVWSQDGNLVASTAIASAVLESDAIVFSNLNQAIPYGQSTFYVKALANSSGLDQWLSIRLEPMDLSYADGLGSTGDYIYGQAYFNSQALDPNHLHVTESYPNLEHEEVPYDSHISITFDRSISFTGTGVHLMDLDTNTERAFVTSEFIYAHNNNLSFNLPGQIVASSNLYIVFPQGSLRSFDGLELSPNTGPLSFSVGPHNSQTTYSNHDLVLSFDHQQYTGQPLPLNKMVSLGSFGISNKHPSQNHSLNTFDVDISPNAEELILSAELWDSNNESLMASISQAQGGISASGLHFVCNIDLPANSYREFEIRVTFVPTTNIRNGEFRILSESLVSASGSSVDAHFSSPFYLEDSYPYDPNNGFSAQLSPRHLEDNVYFQTSLYMHFDRFITFSGTGNVVVRDHESQAVVLVGNASNGNLHLGESYLYINPPSNGYQSPKLYSVSVSQNFIKDVITAEPLKGISEGQWLFHTGSFSEQSTPDLVLEASASAPQQQFSQRGHHEIFRFNLNVQSPTVLKSITLQSLQGQMYSNPFFEISLYQNLGSEQIFMGHIPHFYLGEPSIFESLGWPLEAGLHEFSIVVTGGENSSSTPFSLELYPSGVVSVNGSAQGASISNTIRLNPWLHLPESRHQLSASSHQLSVSTTTEIQAYGINALGYFPNQSYGAQVAAWHSLHQGDIAMIGSGLGHGVALLKNGEVWGWGNNEQGQLGPMVATTLSTPTLISSQSTAVFVGAIAYNTYFLDDQGAITIYGRNHQGQLGAGHQNPELRNNTLSLDIPISKVSMGVDHGLAIAQGRLYAWGSNGFGQLGGEFSSPSDLRFVDDSQVWTQCFAGGFHSFAINENGQVFAWGKNHRGQLGLGHNGIVTTPTPSGYIPNDISDIQLGYDFSLFLRTSGEVMVAGSRRLSTYEHMNQDLFYPYNIYLPTSFSIAAGPFAAYAYTVEGIYQWGQTPSGYRSTPEALPFVKSVTEGTK